MSVKAFISAEAHLAKLGFTVQQAKAFIESNASKPDVIFATARQYGVTTNMLSEISGYSNDVIRGYFDASGEKSAELDYTSLLVNSDLGNLENLVGFNEKTGALSNASLRATVKSFLSDKNSYEPTFSAIHTESDGIYDAEELGVGHLLHVAATNENIESLFYGTLINIFERIDKSELSEINNPSLDKNSNEYKQLLLNALTDSPDTIAWSDKQMVDLVTEEAAHIIDQYWSASLVGVLDHSYLGIISNH